MSALAQKQTFAAHKPMSAKCQERTLASLFDHLVGAIKQGRRHGKPERLGGLQVNHQFEFGGGLHRQVSRLLAFKDAINVTSSFAVWINRFWPITEQAAVGAVRGGMDRLRAIDNGLRER